jgi:hypothetical protein
MKDKGVIMSKFFILSLCFISLGVFAQPKTSTGMPSSSPGPMNFKEQKTKMLESLDYAISHMTKHRECINSSNDQAGLQKCMDKARKEAEERMKKMNPEGFKKMQAPSSPVKPNK